MKPCTALMTGVVVSLSCLSELLAAEWEKQAGLSVGAEFSDNICLSDDDRQSRGYGTLTPDVSLRGQGARTNVGLDASVRFSTLGDSDIDCAGGQGFTQGDRQTFIPRLRYHGDYELIQDWLTLESDASARTRNLDPFAPGDPDTFDGRGNTNVVYQYGAGALIQRRYFNSADLRVRYHYNEQNNDAQRLGDSSQNLGEFNLNTEPSNNRLTFGLSGRYREVEYEGTETVPPFENTLSSAEVSASLRLGASWQISALVGEESNEFVSLRPEIDGEYWDASLRWSPNERVEVNVGTGERFFGTTPHASIRYRHRRSELIADYNRRLRLPRDLRGGSGLTGDRFGSGFDPALDPAFDPALDPAFDPVLGPGFGPGEFPDTPTFIGNTPIINEQLRLTYRYTGQRTTIAVTATNSQQQRLADLADAEFSTLGLSLTRSLSSNLSATANLRVREGEGRGDNAISTFREPAQTWRAAFGLNRQLGRDTNISMSYEHTRRDSESEFSNYTENRLVLTARHRF